MSDLRICRKCGHTVSYNSYFKAYYCMQCGNMVTPPKTVFDVITSSPENMVECLSAVAPFSICDLVCGNKCTAIDNFRGTAEEQCKDKIRKFLSRSMTTEENEDGEDNVV